MFKIIINKIILNSNNIFKHNFNNIYSKNRFNSMTINYLNETNINDLKIKGNSKHLIERKSMNRLIRKCLPISTSDTMDWNRLEYKLKTNYNLNNNDFKRIVIPIVCNQLYVNELVYNKNLLSLFEHLKPSMTQLSDPLLLTYHFLILSKLIQNMIDFSTEENIEFSKSLLMKIMSEPIHHLDNGLTTRIIVIIRQSLLCLANSSVFNCILAISLWKIVLNVFNQQNNDWNRLIHSPNIMTNDLICFALQNSLLSETLDLIKLSIDLIDFQMRNKNIKIYLKILKIYDSTEEIIKLLDILKMTGILIIFNFMLNYNL